MIDKVYMSIDNDRTVSLTIKKIFEVKGENE